MSDTSILKAFVTGIMVFAGTSNGFASSNTSEDSIKIVWKGQEFPGAIHQSTQGADGVSFSKFFANTQLKMFDPGYQNTAPYCSGISLVDGQNGQLFYRGYSIKQLAEATYPEVVFLLIYGDLPDKHQLSKFSEKIMKYDSLARKRMGSGPKLSENLSPVSKLTEGLTKASGYFPELAESELNPEDQDDAIAFMLSQMSQLTSKIYHSKKPFNRFKKATHDVIGYLSSFSFLSSVSYLTQTHTPILTDHDYVSNFIRQTWGESSPEIESGTLHRVLTLLFILHAEHGQNCSTSTVRGVASAKADIFASVISGIHALSGHAHGKASEDVVNLFEILREQALNQAKQSGSTPEEQVDQVIHEYLEKVLRKEVKLPGFGHRVYKKTDPRAKIIKSAAMEYIKEAENSLELKIALRLEALAMENAYFTDRHLYPNVDFYSGLVYKTAGIPKDMMTVMFALSRTSGWLAHWKEMQQEGFRIARPGQIYLGKSHQDRQRLSSDK